MSYIRLVYKGSKVSCFCLVFFDFIIFFFVSFSKCESILDRGRAHKFQLKQIVTNVLGIQITEDTVYHKENQCLRTKIKVRT